MFFYILISTLLISFGALVGAATLSKSKKVMGSLLLVLVSLSAGTMMGGAFIHLLPESLELLSVETVFLIVLLAYLAFLMMENLLHWHHCHQGEEETHDHTLGYMNLVGDGVHNFIDGMIIAGSFMTSFELGVVTTIAVALHEIPQEISDFGVLIYSGLERRRALMLNFLAGLMTVVGGMTGLFLAQSIEGLISNLLPFAAGGFIYIATTDLVPQIKNQNQLSKAIKHVIVFVIGILIMYGLRVLLETH
jgi:zinc and cadmium transporter